MIPARPRVSVLLPVRNGLPWLGAAVDGILRQTHTSLELIVLEDGSTDGTPCLLESIADARVRVIPTGGIGIARALNLGLEAARGIYIARQDADDESLPTRLAEQVAFLERRPDVDVVATVADYIDAAGNTVHDAWVDTVRRQQDVAVTPEAIAALLPLTCCVTHGSVVARTHVLRAAGGYRPEMVPAEDYDLWLRLLPHHRFAKLSARLYRHRLHDGQSSSKAKDQQVHQTIFAKLLHVRRLFPNLAWPASLAVVGATRGDAYYEAVSHLAGFDARCAGAYSPAVAAQLARDWDVVALTDFIAAERDRGRLRLPAGTQVVGNLLVRTRRWAAIPA